MSTLKSPWDLSEIKISESTIDAALDVVQWFTREKDDAVSQWETVMRLAHNNGASLREIAKAAGISPQTVSNIVKR